MSDGNEIAFADSAEFVPQPKTLAELVESADPEIGMILFESRQWLENHYWPIKKDKLFPDRSHLTDLEQERVINAVAQQLVKSHNVVLYMVWRCIPTELKELVRTQIQAANPALASDKLRALLDRSMPLTQKAFCKSIGVSERTISNWRRNYPRLEEHLLLARSNGPQIVDASLDMLLREVVHQAMNRGNNKQHNWMNLALEVSGAKKPQKTVSVNIDFDKLTDEQIDRIAAGEDPEKVVQG